MVRFFSLAEQAGLGGASEQPLPKLKPQPPRTLKVFSRIRGACWGSRAVLVVGDRHDLYISSTISWLNAHLVSTAWLMSLVDVFLRW